VINLTTFITGDELRSAKTIVDRQEQGAAWMSSVYEQFFRGGQAGPPSLGDEPSFGGQAGLPSLGDEPSPGGQAAPPSNGDELSPGGQAGPPSHGDDPLPGGQAGPPSNGDEPSPGGQAGPPSHGDDPLPGGQAGPPSNGDEHWSPPTHYLVNSGVTTEGYVATDLGVPVGDTLPAEQGKPPEIIAAPGASEGSQETNVSYPHWTTPTSQAQITRAKRTKEQVESPVESPASKRRRQSSD
jgi:hypothetical protein